MAKTNLKNKSLNQRALFFGLAIDMPATNRKERRFELKKNVRETEHEIRKKNV